MKLKIWNGRGFKSAKDNTYYSHIYVCAKTIKQAIDLCNELAGHENINYNEVKNYWSKGLWGNAMEGISQEVGVWGTTGYPEKPIRLI